MSMWALCIAGSLAAVQADPLDVYDVVWSTPSTDSSGSIPLGNGEVGLNVWAEESGDIVFYMARTDAWSENARLLKLGRVRISMAPNPLAGGTTFEQALRLREGAIVIRTGEIVTRIWVDAHAPVVRIESEGNAPFGMRVALEVWRTEARELLGEERVSAYGLVQSPDPVVVTPDTIVADIKDRVVWYHRNERSIWPLTLKLQGMESWLAQGKDPLLNRTFGGAIAGEGFESDGDALLCSSNPSKTHRLCVILDSRQTGTAQAWLETLDKLVEQASAKDWAGTRKDHEAWWRAFWGRSYIHMRGQAAGKPMVANNLPLRIGADSQGKNPFLGHIRDVLVHPKALDEGDLLTKP
ncbi:MAG TPA: hypothetical protein ENN80_07120, partial [Candidatus Hydrogenedentes bacterium]|nr:hypothetical protein [Candidatus Hydrogenedentota bacterium]